MLGTGAYGLALASKLAGNGHKVVMWTENKDKEKEYQTTHNLKSINSSYELSDNIEVTSNIEDVMNGAKIIFFTCASKYTNEVASMILPYFEKDMVICIASKGIEEKTCHLLSNVIKFVLNAKNVTVISGPTFAVDMLAKEPVALAIAGTNRKSQNLIIKVLACDTVKLRISKDLIGVQEELLRFAYKLTANREEANDLLQETSLKALDNEEKYVPDTNFKGWMYTIMRNIFINNYRKIVRDQTYVDQTDNLFHLNLPQDSGFESTEGAYDLKEMHRVVNALPKEYKVPFSMHVSGFKYREIAEKLELPLGTVKSRIFFTRQRLQQELKDFV